MQSPAYLCGCSEETCESCPVMCPVCKQKGHKQDAFLRRVKIGVRPSFACRKHSSADMQTRVQLLLPSMAPTVREKKSCSVAEKRKLAQLALSPGKRYENHARQAAHVDADGLGGAAASSLVRTAEDVAAVIEDDGASRDAGRALGAYAGDSAARWHGVTINEPPILLRRWT